MELRICSKCNLEKSTVEFNFRDKKLNKINNCCRDCTKNYYNSYYSRNRKKEIARSKLSTIQTRNKNRNFLLNYLNSHPCIDCGESDPIVLEFDHVRDIKYKEISRMAWSCNSITSLKKEIEKCDVRCANCHRRKTAKEFGHWKYMCSAGVNG